MDLSRTALVIAAHGDRGSVERNAVLRKHAASLREHAIFESVSYGVLNGEPALAAALREASLRHPQRILIYPFFMSGGYFVRKVLPERANEAGLSQPVHVLEPLGLDPALPDLLLRRSLAAALDAGFAPAQTRLIIAGHGSKLGRASAEATEAIADAVRDKAAFAKAITAFIEEPPFIADALAAEPSPAVIAGLFSGEGMHGHDDLGAAIAQASAPCVYTRPIGADPEIVALIKNAVLKAACNLADQPAEFGKIL